MRKNYFTAIKLLSALFLIFAIGCKRDNVLENVITPVPPTPTTNVVNDLTQVTASVSGIVLDESNAPIPSAVVTSGATSTTTNSNGMFIFQNISLSKENGSVTVVKAGYFKGVKSFKTTAGKNHTVRLQLMQKVLSGSVNAAAGGTINSNGGASIIFPAAAFFTSTGAGYTGTVNVYSRWISPTDANLPFIIPGDLRGVGTDGAENLLETYGMVGAELEDASGNALKIATGKKATISFPLPASLQASAPATIQLWHFDDATARWKENGTAAKTGSTYSAQIDQFSFWNCDVPNTNYINLDYTLINAATNSPLVSTSTRIKRSNGTYGYGITNNAGFVSGLVPKNEQLVLEVIATSGCNNIVFSQNIGPLAGNTSLGSISINLPAIQYLSFSGTVVNCAAAPVTNGYLSFYGTGGNNAFVSTSANGSFAFSILNCSGASIGYTYHATDYTTTQQSAILAGNATSGAINMGSINACGTLSGIIVYMSGFVKNAAGKSVATLWKNGIATDLTDGTNSANANSVFVLGSDVYVAGNEENASGISIAKVWKNSIAINLTNGTNNAYANSVFVVGTDIYVAGDERTGSNQKPTAKLWKNGVVTSLTTGNNYNYGSANSVFLSGSDVYVAGNESFLSGVSSIFYYATVWKNGVATYLPAPRAASATSVFVSGSDIYVAGFETNMPTVAPSGTSIGSPFLGKVWKNGMATILTNSFLTASTTSVFVLGNDVYAAGFEYIASDRIAKVWKNGIGTNLIASNVAGATSVFVLGNDVYVAGFENNVTSGISIAKFWKNGIATNLTNGTMNSMVNSIFVK